MSDQNPTQSEAGDSTSGGVLGWFSRNRVAANAIMVFLLLAGAATALRMKIEIFPNIETGLITVTVPYLGASPSEVEDAVNVRIEEAIQGVEGIKEIRSVAMEGSGVVIAEAEGYADVRRVLDDIKNEVDRIDTFPEQTEEPIIAEVTNRRQVLTMALFGDVSERTLKALAENIRDELTATGTVATQLTTGPIDQALGMIRGDRGAISQVEIFGMRDYEISIEVSEAALRRHGLRFEDVARIVSQSSVDLPGGSIDTEGGEILIRTEGEKETGDQFADIVLLTNPDGTRVKLRDVATVVDGFEESDVATYFDGQRAAMLNVFRVGEQGALEVADSVHEYVRQKAERLPEGVSVATWFDRSELLAGRLNLLLRNAAIGLVLVFLVLTLFLDLRLAFWTTMGIPISFMGSLFLLPLFGVSINMISLFAFIVVLGIVVDDAIVVGENIFAYRQAGRSPLQAAVEGVKEMAAPVTFAILTTVAAFMPMLYTEGDLGKVLRTIPVVVIAVLLISLVEALLILPAHLNFRGRGGAAPGPIARVQGLFRRGLQWVIDKPYTATVRRAVRGRYVTMAIALALLLLTIGGLRSGFVLFKLFPPINADNVWATLTMPQGTPLERTREVVARLEEAAMQLKRELEADRPPDAPPVVEHISTTIGQQPFTQEMGGPGVSAETGGGTANLAEVNIQLLEGERRQVSSDAIGDRWRELVGEVPGVSELTFTSAIFSAGDDINLELAHPDFDKLLQATDQLKQALGRFAGVSEIRDSFEPGKLELELSLTERGRTAGLTLRELASQVRYGFYGNEAQRILRGRDELKVMVRYPEAYRTSVAAIETMRVRLPDGTELPFAEVAEVVEGRGYATIDRADRRRVVNVIADVNEQIANANQINRQLAATVLPQLRRDYPGLAYSFEGEQKEQQESVGSLIFNTALALLVIYGLLGVLFRSYLQPIVVMSAIPFGVVGAIAGHLIMGYTLTLLSLFGVVALAGVVVNDSLIMIDLINRERGRGVNLDDVLVHCGTRRFRPILLTTATTFFGLLPMIFETSLQARFLIPMAISLGFGVVFATGITLILVPSFYMILEDIRGLLLRGQPGAAPAPLHTDPTAA